MPERIPEFEVAANEPVLEAEQNERDGGDERGHQAGEQHLSAACAQEEEQSNREHDDCREPVEPAVAAGGAGKVDELDREPHRARGDLRRTVVDSELVRDMTVPGMRLCD